jgi:quinol monooxygenase YgiN
LTGSSITGVGWPPQCIICTGLAARSGAPPPYQRTDDGVISQTKHDATGKVVSAYYTLHPEDRQAFIDAVIPHLSTTAQQDGCVYYVFAQDLTDPNTIHLMEGWRDQAAIDEHNADENFHKAVAAVLGSVRILGYQAEVYDVAAQTAGAIPSDSEATD